MANPAYVTRVATILQSGSVMATRFTVYETHLSFILQFLCDFGLYGCGIIEFEEVFERCSEESEEPPTTSSNSFGVSSYFRESRLPLEVDAIAPNILNRHRLVARNLHHCLEIPAPSFSSEPLVLGVRELWEDERNHRQALGLNPSPEIPKDPSESSRGVGGDWVAEAQWWDELRKRIENGKDQEASALPEVQEDWQRLVMTTFESIEAIWDKEHRTWKPPKQIHSPGIGPVDNSDERPSQDYAWHDNDHSNIADQESPVDVDVSLLSNEDMDRLDQQEALDSNKEEIHDLQAEENEDDYEDNFFDDQQLEENVEDATVNSEEKRESRLLMCFIF